MDSRSQSVRQVSTHSRPKAAGHFINAFRVCAFGFNTQPPEGGWAKSQTKKKGDSVSTHSRPKAAGACLQDDLIVDVFQHTAARRRLGGGPSFLCQNMRCFNTQPPEGGWDEFLNIKAVSAVSTHSRPKAAGFNLFSWLFKISGFNTQPPEGGWRQHLLQT